MRFGGCQGLAAAQIRLGLSLAAAELCFGSCQAVDRRPNAGWVGAEIEFGSRQTRVRQPLNSGLAPARRLPNFGWAAATRRIGHQTLVWQAPNEFDGRQARVWQLPNSGAAAANPEFNSATAGAGSCQTVSVPMEMDL